MCLDLEKILIIELKNELFEQKMEKKNILHPVA